MNTSTFPILKTERLTLRQVSIDDCQDIYDLRSDPEINKYLNRPPCVTTEDAKNFIKKINENIEKGGTYYWVISFTDTKQVVGTICLFDFSNENSSCEIGYELLVKFQGQGIMLEVLHKVINFVFETLKLRKIVAFTHNENHNSTNLLLKCNFSKSTESDKENPNLSIYTLNQ